MDTSGTNIGKAPTAKPDLYSKEELSSILKFGAANIFNTAVDQTALEQMDLDDVINKAEAYDTETAPTGTSLGGEAFLNQFAVQDVKSDMTSWDDIIPADIRATVLAEDRKIKAEASGSGNGYARAAQGGAGNYDDKAGRTGPVDRYQDLEQDKKKTVRKTDAQRAVDLKEKDIRGLVRGIQKYGDIRYRYDDIVKEAKLESKERTVITRTVTDLLVVCRAAIVEKQDMLEGRKAAGDEVTQAMRNKATIISFKGANNINAETTAQRSDELRVIHNGALVISFHFTFPSSRRFVMITELKDLEDVTKWELPVDSSRSKSTANWTCDWNTTDDAHLIVGIWRHGHGNWEEIHKDASLQLQGKFFLEETKKGDAKDKSLPNSIHLSRRTDYLSGLLFEHVNEAGNNVAKVPRTKSKAKPKSESTVSSETIKKPSASKPSSASTKKPSPGRGKSSGTKLKSAATYTSSESESEAESMDEAQLKEDLRPVKKELKKLAAGTEGMDRDEKVLLFKECLTKIGQEIKNVAMKEKSDQARDKRIKHLCSFPSFD